MVSSNSCHAGIVTAGIAVVMTIVSVAGQAIWSDCSRNGCRRPNKLPNSVAFVLTNYPDIWTYCFPFNTTLLYVCKEQNSHQFKPMVSGSNLLNRKCTGSGWLDDNHATVTPPRCEERKKHCLWPPVPIGPNIFVQIDSQNVSIVDSSANSARYYSENTIATYKCMYPQFLGGKEVHQTWRCIKEEHKKYVLYLRYTTVVSWKWINQTAQDLLCDPPLDTPNRTEKHSITKTTSIFTTETSFTFGRNDFDFINFTDRQQTTRRNVIIGICGAMAFVLITLLLGVFYRNRLMFGKRYGDSSGFASQRSLAPIMEEQTKCNQTNEGNLLYANIIPIKVNSETIYTEVETGEVGGDGKLGTKVKYIVGNDQLQTVYAEIHHPV